MTELKNQIEQMIQKADVETEEQRNKLREMIKLYHDIFYKKGTKIIPLVKTKHRILLTSDKPIRLPPRTMSEDQLKVAKETITEMIDLGVIRPSKSPYAACTVLIKKSDGSYRCCIDYRRLNQITVRDSFPLPLINDLITRVGQARYFTKLDLYKGYYQTPMHQDDIENTAFNTPFGLYEFTMMPMGLSNSAATFQAMMQEILSPHLHLCCVVYIDDIFVYSDSLDEHIRDVGKVLKCLQDAGLKTRPDKTSLCKQQVRCLGFDIDRDGVKPFPEKINAIKNVTVEKSRQGIMSFLGLVRYYQRFAKNLAEIALPLTRLLKKNVKVEEAWGEEQDKAVEAIKLAFSKPGLVLTRYDPNRPIVLQTDASSFALGAVISHYEVDEKGKRINEQPISFASKTLNPCQINYSTTEREGLAVVWATDLFRSLLLGKRFILETDHSALKQLLTTRDPAGRMCRWMLKLQELDADICHKKGEENVPADFMSRMGANSNEPPPQTLTMLGIFGKNGKDLDVDKIREAYDEACEEDLATQYNIKKGEGLYERVLIRLVPTHLTNEVIRTCHNDGMAGHQSKKRTIDMLKESYSWPNMNTQVNTFIDFCETCQKYNTPNISKEVGEYPDPGAPFRVVAMDFIGPLGDKKQTRTYKHIMVLVDVFSRFVFLTACKSTGANEVITAFRDKIIPMCGIPSVCMMDMESSFMSSKFRTFANDIGMYLKAVPQGASNSNGMVERAIKTVQQHLKKMTGEDNWKQFPRFLPAVEFLMRNSRRDDINLSPAEILFGFRCRGPYSNSLPTPTNALSPLQLWTMARREYRRLRSEADLQQRRKIKEQTASTQGGPRFRVGDLVRRRIKISRNKKGLPRKWWPQWSESYRVLE
ncbi:unnamed protein product, partial [Heterosigma akashiwo]